MMRLAAMTALATMALLTACGQPDGGTPPAAPPEEAATAPQSAEEATAQDACGAGAHLGLIGADAAAIDRSTLPTDARVIAPDTVVTQDFRPDRLNVIVGADNRISSLACY